MSKILIAENFFGTLSYTLIREVNFSLRAFATVIAFTIGFVFWVQNYSDLAEKNKLDDLKITSLLQEKDLLIANLTNQKMLLESGGLAVGLAHELNQYLGSIRLNVEQVIHANHSDLNNPFLKKSLERVLSANDQATTIIRNLKKLFIFSNTKENLDSIQLEVSVGEVVNLYRERIKQAHIDLELNLPASRRVSVNDSPIRQVVVNLIVNSIDALDSINQENKRIAITLIELPDSIVLDFFDNGPGIHEGGIKNLFHLFQTTKIGGNGIGLWLSKHIVESLGGQLVVHSAAPGNTIFRVQFPIEKS